MNKWPPNKGNFMSQFLCFFDTTILCQQQLCPIFHTAHHTTDHLLTRLLFPYVECPYLWIWSMTFFWGKRTSSESKKVFCCCHYRYQFSNLSADADIGDCPPKYTGISLWGSKRGRVLHSSEIKGLCLMKWPSVEKCFKNCHISCYSTSFPLINALVYYFNIDIGPKICMVCGMWVFVMSRMLIILPLRPI